MAKEPKTEVFAYKDVYPKKFISEVPGITAPQINQEISIET